MGQLSESRRPDEETATLLRLAVQLRQAATAAGRADVVTGVDEVIVAIGGLRGPVDDGGEKDGEGKANAIIKFLDGLGL